MADSEGRLRGPTPRADSDDRLRRPTPKTDSEDRRRRPTPRTDAEDRLRRPTPKTDSETDAETDAEDRLRNRRRRPTPKPTPKTDAEDRRRRPSPKPTPRPKTETEPTPRPTRKPTRTPTVRPRSSTSRATPRSRTLLPAPGAKKPRQLRVFTDWAGDAGTVLSPEGACKRVRLRGFWRLRLQFWRLRLCGLWSRWCDGTTETWGSRCGGRRARLRSMSRRGTAVRVAIALRGFRARLGRRARCAGRCGWRWRGGMCRRRRLRAARSCSIGWRRSCTGWGRGAERRDRSGRRPRPRPLRFRFPSRGRRRLGVPCSLVRIREARR